MSAVEPQPQATVLVVEDDEDDFVIARELLGELPEQFEAVWAKSFESGLEQLLMGDFAACLLDYRLGARTGLDLLAEARRRGCRVPIILLTGSTGADVDREAVHAGASDYLVKGEITATQLGRSIRYARENARNLEATRRSHQEFRDVIEKLPACILIRRGETVIYANPATAAATGHAGAGALVGKSIFELVHPSSHALLIPNLSGNAAPSAVELCIVRGDGTTMMVETAPEHIPITFEGSPAFLTSIRDVTKEKAAAAVLSHRAEQMEALSLTDELTRLNNRRGFLTLGEQQLKAGARLKQPAVLLFIDLDGLKAINDGLGHETGDAAILACAQVLRATFRDADILARLGGDEFVALCSDCADGRAVLQRLASVLEAFNRNERHPFGLSVSTGACAFNPAEPEALEVLMQRADAEMYQQKRARKEARARESATATFERNGS